MIQRAAVRKASVRRRQRAASRRQWETFMHSSRCQRAFTNSIALAIGANEGYSSNREGTGQVRAGEGRRDGCPRYLPQALNRISCTLILK